jgi:hypothetical protein
MSNKPMVSRRTFVVSAGAALGALPPLVGCSSADDVEEYRRAAEEARRTGANGESERPVVYRELVRLATLAPSSHNTQCWRFRIEPPAITVLPDLSRRCPAVDPDDHHLFVSLGCASENLVQAALANALHGTVAVDPAGDGAIRIVLEPTRAVASPLVQAIPERQSTRGVYDGQRLSIDELRQLEAAGTGDGVRLLLLTDRSAMEGVLDFVIQGNTAQMADPAFMAELTSWIRFNPRDAIRTGDGLFGGTTGNPSTPAWLGKLLLGAFFTPKKENEKYAAHVRSSAGIAVFAADVSDRAHWVNVGRCYERFALQATVLGIRTAHLNQPVEVASIRSQFATSLGLEGRRPDLVVRFGRGPTMLPSLRRPLRAVIA